MQSSRSRGFHVAYSLTPDTLSRVVDLIYSVAPNLTFAVSCSDSSILEVKSLKELLELSNPAHREITRIAVKSERSSNPTKVELTLNSDDELWDTVSYSISGDDKDVVYVSAEIEKWLSSTKTYNLSSIHPLVRFAAALLIGTAGVLMGLVRVLDVAGHSKLATPSWFTWVGLGLIVTPIVVLRMRQWIFPIGDFALGDGAGRSTRRRQLRSNLFWVVVVGCAVGVLVAAIIKHLP
jgi:hypothetical protein